jgi:Mn2+/Fe2+ NRAMP family transporter
LKRLYIILAPGILVAATGVGAGDLITASLAGANVGVVILWAALFGAALKFSLNEGLARWQLATETTLLEGWVDRLGAWVQWLFVIYLVVWSFMVGGALVNACGIAGDGLLPLSKDPGKSKIIWGVIHSAAGLLLVLAGGFKLFHRLMAAMIGVMFVTVIATAALLKPDLPAVASGLVMPKIPEGSLAWTLGLLGGVGGTLTLLSYGYWIREQGREGEEGLRTCRIDLAAAYALTALFGIAMVIIGSRLPATEAERARLPLVLAGQLAGSLGPWSKWVFLAGFWCAVFSSLLGVWQSAPYMFADFMRIRKGASRNEARPEDLSKSRFYKIYLVGIAFAPLITLWYSLEAVQLMYAVLGAFFMPFLALTLLLMNNRKEWVGERFINGWLTNGVLILTLVFFTYAGIRRLID